LLFLGALFSIIIISIASGAGAAGLTIAEKLEDIINSKEQIRQAIETQGVEVGSGVPLSQYGAKIGEITCDVGGFANTICATLGPVNPAGGTFHSVHPFDSVMTCRYTAPAKSITGCSSVQSNTVAYNGTSWPDSTYAITANAGYIIANNNTASATCTSCAGACTTSQSCTPVGCTVANGTCVFTNSGTQTRSADCTNSAGNTDTSMTCAAWGSCSAGTTKTVSCDSGYTPQNQGTDTAVCTALSKDFCSVPLSSSTTLSINSIFSSICSPLNATTKFPYAKCGGYTPSSRGTGVYDWTGTSCPLVSTTTTIYGNARCSTQYDRNHGFDPSLYDAYNSSTTGFCFRSQSSAPSNDPGTGQYCWCQLCTSSAKTSCGGWMYQDNYGLAADCTHSCTYACGYYVADVNTYTRATRSALCAAPTP